MDQHLSGVGGRASSVQLVSRRISKKYIYMHSTFNRQGTLRLVITSVLKADDHQGSEGGRTWEGELKRMGLTV